MNFDDLFSHSIYDELDDLVEGFETPESTFRYEECEEDNER